MQPTVMMAGGGGAPEKVPVTLQAAGLAHPPYQQFQHLRTAHSVLIFGLWVETLLPCPLGDLSVQGLLFLPLRTQVWPFEAALCRDRPLAHQARDCLHRTGGISGGEGSLGIELRSSACQTRVLRQAATSPTPHPTCNTFYV